MNEWVRLVDFLGVLKVKRGHPRESAQTAVGKHGWVFVNVWQHVSLMLALNCYCFLTSYGILKWITCITALPGNVFVN